MKKYNLNSWSESDLKRAFRVLVLAFVACRVLLIFMPYGPYKNWSTGDVMWFDAWEANGKLLHKQFLSPIGFWGMDVPVKEVLWLFEIIAAIGLLLMHGWSRMAYVSVVLGGWAYTLFGGPGIGGGLLSVVSWITSMIEGIILLLIFTSPIRDIMDRNEPEVAAIESA